MTSLRGGTTKQTRKPRKSWIASFLAMTAKCNAAMRHCEGFARSKPENYIFLTIINIFET